MKKPKIEFSKKIFIFVAAVAVIVTAFTMYMVWETKDISPLAYLIPAIFAEMGTGTAFYYWKARCENLKKMEMEYKNENLPTDEIKNQLEELKNEKGEKDCGIYLP